MITSVERITSLEPSLRTMKAERGTRRAPARPGTGRKEVRHYTFPMSLSHSPLSLEYSRAGRVLADHLDVDAQAAENRMKNQNMNVYGKQADDRGSTGNDYNEAI